ncbi:uncharacterized protein PRCAT00004343001 [Priceomyces carsonii]|uniref:uncharacterized protein n=1 Tax=Priceomyces carsonii TaxID=28549 RepID=UPI002EDAF293|nr:unnamed protein product [Priceomyces carsonii]
MVRKYNHKTHLFLNIKLKLNYLPRTWVSKASRPEARLLSNGSAKLSISVMVLLSKDRSTVFSRVASTPSRIFSILERTLVRRFTPKAGRAAKTTTIRKVMN